MAKPKRRQFTAEYRLRILEEADRCTQPGEVGRLLRREGLYSSHLTAWRKARRKGSLRELAAKKRGAKPAERNPLDAKVRALEAQVGLMNRRQRGVGKPETFDFLGLTHYCTTTRRGRFRLGRKPVAKRVNRTLARIDEVLRKRWHHDIWEVGRWLGRVCNGWLNYFAVPGSGRFIRAFLRRLQRRWMRALRRRSQRARFSWKRLSA